VQPTNLKIQQKDSRARGEERQWVALVRGVGGKKRKMYKFKTKTPKIGS